MAAINRLDLMDTVDEILEQLAETYEPDEIIEVLSAVTNSLPRDSEARLTMRKVTDEFIHRDASLSIAWQETAEAATLDAGQQRAHVFGFVGRRVFWRGGAQ